MNRRRTWAIARKELLHVMRDPRSLGMGIAIPVLLLVLFGYALSLDVDHVPLAVWDLDGSPASRDLVRSFVHSPAFESVAVCRSLPETEEAIQSGRATAALVIPTEFSTDLSGGRQARVQLLVDGSDANTARLSIMYAEGILARMADRVPANGAVSLVSAYNPAMNTRWSIIPGLIAIIVNVIAAMLTSLCIAREWENGTMEQLVSTPVRRMELIAGKLLPYYAIGVADILIAVGMALFLFGIPLNGSVLALAGVSGIFLLGALSVGVLISTLARSQLLASQLSLVITFLPGFLLSGFVYDIGAMPPVVGALTRIIPARYFVSLLRSLFLKGRWGPALTLDLVLLSAFTILVLAVTLRKLRLDLDGGR
jgi:ABC-2 type transport system permease protein